MKLHTSESIVLVELWSGIKNYIPAKDQRDCAEQYISNIEDVGLADLSIASTELYGVCDVFDQALKKYCRENGYGQDDDADDIWDD